MKNMIRVWTIQPEIVWTKLQNQKVLLVDPELITTDQSWMDSFDWMREQMRKRTSGYKGNYPWWAWYAPRPDLRKLRHIIDNESGIPYVRIELLLPEEKVLISHLDAWVFVINRWSIPYTRKEFTWWSNQKDLHNGFLPAHLQAQSDATWERIFDRDLPARGMVDREDLDHGLWVEDYWQATFEELRLEDVRKVTHFVSNASR